MVRFSFLILISIFVVACTSMPNPAGKPIAAMTFDHIQPKPIYVSRIESSAVEQHAGAKFFQPVDEATLSYFANKFKAHDDGAGQRGTLKILVEQAVVLKTHEKAQHQVANFLDVAGFDVYNVIVQVRIEHLDSQGFVKQGNVVTARRFIKISEHASLAERDRRQLEGMEALFNDLDDRVEEIVLDDMDLRI